ncbi:Non-reducing polyketide synthase PKS12 [Colletotrichum siamense]|uniref:Non-reducing polyketide synthase PKS12 n=1 Tax=Colletotrichum siamense TaxID=690259 RepID=UPI0018733D7B|nr:Non-reducing polyketide synthase PKS12 [Colletotrichum siamense]KAF5485412.1 Non-reducing polyketide synthase PKS12 [Colletotrichum siamense]
MAQDDPYYVTGGMRAFGPGRLNHFFGWDGPSLSVDTACSSSAMALDLAIQSLRGGKCDMAIAGGASVISGAADTGMYAGLGCGGFLGASNTACKTFDAAADGYTRAEAVAVVVLKRLSDARRDGDIVHGVIRGIATNHSTDTNPITRPSTEAQKSLLRQVLQQSLRYPADVSYVEVHGSGTQAGDRAEVEAVAAVLGGRQRRRSSVLNGSSRKLRIGSVKANIGHSEGAAGISALIKALLMIRHGQIPPHIGVRTTANHHFPDLDKLDISINLRQESLIPEEEAENYQAPANIIINCFGAAGGNTSMLVESFTNNKSLAEEDFNQRQAKTTEQHLRVVTVSGKTPSALQANSLRLLEFLDENPTTPINNLSYTACERRGHYPYRTAYTAKDTIDLATQLRDGTEANDQSSAQSSRPSQPPNVVFVFSGQGGKVAGAAQHLFSHNDIFRRAICDYSQLCDSLGFSGVLGHLTSPESEEASLSAVLEQVALLVFELALCKMWQVWGIRPSVVLGHSLGEYAALHLAGILSASDTIWLVGTRAGLVQKFCKTDTRRMLAIFAEEEHLIPFIKDCPVEISCKNSPSQTVVGGSVDDILALKSRLQKQNIKSALVGTPYAFHTGQMDHILESLRCSAKQVSFKSHPQLSLVSTMTGSRVDSCPSWSEHLVKHTRQPVLFAKAIQSAIDLNPGRKTILVTISPTRICKDMTAANISPTGGYLAEVLDAMGTNTHGCIDNIAFGLAKIYNAGIDINWSAYHKSMKQAGRLLELPSYAFDLKDFWIPLHQKRSISSSPTSTSRSSSPTAINTPTTDEDDEDHCLRVMRKTNLQEQPFRSLILGHVIRNKAICPAGVLIDMAFHAATQLMGELSRLDTVELRSLFLKAAVTIHDDVRVNPVHILHTSVEKVRGVPEYAVTFSGERGVHHASCFVRTTGNLNVLGAETTATSLLRAVSRMTRLRNNKDANRLTRTMIYKMWAPVMHYAPEYHVLQDIVLSPVGYEASAKLMTTAREPGKQAFMLDPVWLDGAMQAAGFTVNMSVSATPGAVYVLTECASIRFCEAPVDNNVYTCYVKGESDSSGDVIITVTVFDEEHDLRPVATITGMLFHRLKGKSEPKPDLFTSSINTTERTARLSNSTQVTAPSTTAALNRTLSHNGSNNSSKQTNSNNRNGQLRKLISILAKETYADPAEIEEETSLADLGVDSLVAPIVADAIRIQLGIEVPLISLLEAQTVNDLSSICCNLMSADVDGRTEPGSHLGAIVAGQSDTHGAHRDAAATVSASSTDLSSRILLLQGSSRCTRFLFLLPDASGSSSVYAGLPPHLSAQTNTGIYALESPFYGMSSFPRISMERYCSILVETIRRFQPSGPYLVGGWSIGGRLAYECARQLMQQGETVAGLLLIESYAELTPELSCSPNAISLDHLEATGFFEWSGGRTNAMPEWQRNHMLHLILMNSAYSLPTLGLDANNNSVPVQLVWSAYGNFDLFPMKVLQNRYEIEDGTMRKTNRSDRDLWLKESRSVDVTSSLTEKWRLLTGPVLRQSTVEGDHFDIMIPSTPLNSALEELGYKVFSFQAMWPNWKETIPLWTEAIEAKYYGRCKPYGREEFDKLLGDYDVVKCPHALLFAEDLAAAYPEARIIVSKRDYEPWRASMEKTVFKLRRSLVFRLLHPLDPFRAAWWPFLRLIMDTAYGGWAEAEPGRKPYDEYHARIEAITRETPERMLVFSGPKDGWVPLCKFLDVPVPETPYPWTNSGADFFERQGHRAGERLLLRKLVERLAVVSGVGMGVYWYMKRP